VKERERVPKLMLLSATVTKKDPLKETAARAAILEEAATEQRYQESIEKIGKGEPLK
jgi:hypothetical protein